MNNRSTTKATINIANNDVINNILVTALITNAGIHIINTIQTIQNNIILVLTLL